MAGRFTFPSYQKGRIFLSEGGTETELMYKHGFELPHFAMFPLLDNPVALVTLKDMFRRYLDVVAKHKMCALMGGLDYRASPDWGALLGYSAAGLAEANLSSIAFLRELAAEYTLDIPEVLIQGLLGPRADAYKPSHDMSVNEAEDYHSVQLNTLKQAKVDLAQAITFSSVTESIGAAKAAEKLGVPLAISFILNSRGKLQSGIGLAEAIGLIDSQTHQSPEYYSINCSHPLEYQPALVEGEWIRRLRGVRPNASKMDKMSLCSIGHLESGDPKEIGQLCGELAKRHPHMDIWGGCCGTWSDHLDEMAKGIVASRSN
ncbi:homocysteine S-methyltransferase family protein [Agarivorans sp. TSD2052]|uniref:homocysteine S-methyltransferase family protein n=1 Tax=Agarivorans sp. TSD2052 TaxID=2937286 RepID=UPI00200EA248|nr:homocysteine S-methyltransferase family protein [Agarivorans sp. TSD2052]UPW20327.1 homocysteine S-methyltransferase family protein [Agarivorans sp. TSD2052]